MLRFSLSFCFLVFTSAVFANSADPVTKIQTTTTAKIYWTLYSDSGVAKIDVTIESNGQPQQIVQSWGFSDYTKAENFFNSKTVGIPLFNPQLWDDVTENVKTQVNKKIWDANIQVPATQ